MNCEDAARTLADRLKALASAEDLQRLEAHLAECPACRAEAEAVTTLWHDMGSLEAIDVPHERMRARFHAALAAYEERERGHPLERWLERIWPARPAYQIALAATFALAGVVIGQALPSRARDEIGALRADVYTMGLALLDHQSASERLLGVTWAQRLPAAPGIVEALAERVQFDSNLNVRLAAAEALRARLDSAEAGAALARALERQDAPLLQVTLANALLERGDADALAAVRALLEREGLDPAVREYLASALNDTAGGVGGGAASGAPAI